LYNELISSDTILFFNKSKTFMIAICVFIVYKDLALLRIKTFLDMSNV